MHQLLQEAGPTTPNGRPWWLNCQCSWRATSDALSGGAERGEFTDPRHLPGTEITKGPSCDSSLLHQPQLLYTTHLPGSAPPGCPPWPPPSTLTRRACWRGPGQQGSRQAARAGTPCPASPTHQWSRHHGTEAQTAWSAAGRQCVGAMRCMGGIAARHRCSSVLRCAAKQPQAIGK